MPSRKLFEPSAEAPLLLKPEGSGKEGPHAPLQTDDGGCEVRRGELNHVTARTAADHADAFRVDVELGLMRFEVGEESA